MRPGERATNTPNARNRGVRDWGLMPRMLRAQPERDLSVELFGLHLPTPLFMAPVGVIGSVHRTATVTGDGSGSSGHGSADGCLP